MMETLKKIIKRAVAAIGIILLIIIVAGLLYRMFMPTPHAPLGKLVKINGSQMHIVQEGKKDNMPTVVIEAGSGLSTEFYHWLSEGLKNHMRVIRYDRIGIGKSEAVDASRNPEAVAHRLHELLQKSGESAPYILVGHSTGGPQIRVFSELYSNEVAGMIFLDATHPDHVQRYQAPKESSFIFKAIIASTELQAVLCDLGIFSLYDALFDTPYQGEGLPEEVNQRIKEYLQTGKAFRTYKEETKHYYQILERSGQKEHFGNLPIRAFYAVSHDSTQRNTSREQLLEKKAIGKHKEFEELSSDGKRIEIMGNHTSIFTKKENAEIICSEILKLSKSTVNK